VYSALKDDAHFNNAIDTNTTKLVWIPLKMSVYAVLHVEPNP